MSDLNNDITCKAILIDKNGNKYGPVTVKFDPNYIINLHKQNNDRPQRNKIYSNI